MKVAVKSLAPNASFGRGRVVEADYAWEDQALFVCVRFAGAEWTCRDTEILDSRYGELDRERRVKERVRLGIRRVFEQVYGLAESPWGILTGVRPMKMVHAMLDRGFPPAELRQILLEVYALSPKKADLLLEVAQAQRPFFRPNPNNPISIYIGIPFCPTRCSYCSFAAYPLETHGHLLKDFLKALHVEIEAVGRLVRELRLQVEAVYLGGGTPTTVQGEDLKRLLGLISEHLLAGQDAEFTVEAGRPETLSRETLNILKAAGTQRICINPQTMHEPTLAAIGRRHTVADVHRAFALAREIGIPVINMDIIVGLPGEELPQVQRTLEEIGALGPDNLTVHSLALKRLLGCVEPGPVRLAQEQERPWWTWRGLRPQLGHAALLSLPAASYPRLSGEHRLCPTRNQFRLQHPDDGGTADHDRPGRGRDQQAGRFRPFPDPACQPQVPGSLCLSDQGAS